MSHPEQMAFVERISNAFPSHFRDCRVLEVGSLDINGSVRPLFKRCLYLGIDLGEGPFVDLVASGATFDPESFDYPFVPRYFKTLISCECFEHNRHWQETFQNMLTLADPGGLIVITCAAPGRGEHGTSASAPDSSPFTNDYYRNLSEADFRSAFDLDAAFADYEFQICGPDLYFWGITPDLPAD